MSADRVSAERVTAERVTADPVTAERVTAARGSAGRRSAARRSADPAVSKPTPPVVPVPRQRRPPGQAEDAIPAFAAASLTQPNARSGRLCDACGNERLTEIAMTLTDGSGALFSSCHRCERKSWRATGTGAFLDVSFDAVLDRTRKIR